MVPVLLTRLASALIFAVSLCSVASAAEVSWEHLLPSGASRGQEVEVEIRGGKLEKWPVDVWTSTTHIAARALEKKGRLAVKIAPDCPTGVHAIRLFDNTTATPIRPFLVSQSEEARESEPNDRLADAKLFKGTTVLNGVFDKVGDADSFAVDLEAGETVVAAMTAHQILESKVDPVLQVLTSDGFVVAQNHDWLGLDPRVAFTAKKTGRHFVRCFTFPSQPNASIQLSGGATLIYRLTVTTEALVDYTYPLTVENGKARSVELVGWNLGTETRELTLPSEQLIGAPEQLQLWPSELATPVTIDVVPHTTLTENSENPSEPQRIDIPSSVTGVLTQPQETDRFSFEGKKDQALRLEIRARRIGSPLDGFLILKGPDGKKIAENDDAADKDPAIQLKLPADGHYTIEIEDRNREGSERYFYLLTATTPPPDFSLSTAANVHTLETGKSLDIVVTPGRKDGLSGFIEITAVDLPPGVRSTQVTSMAAGESTKKVTLTLTADDGITASAPFRIVGRATEHESLERYVRSGKAWMDGTVPHLWLVVKPAAQDGE